MSASESGVVAIVSRGGSVVQLRPQESALARSDDEQRVAVRRRVLKAGVVAYNGRHTTLPCSVRDVSDTGARLRIEGSIAAPDTFELIIPLDGLEASCQVAWRKDQDIGVQFIGAPRIVAAKRIQVVTALAPQGKVSLRRKPRPGEDL
jgi:hypothetical protein